MRWLLRLLILTPIALSVMGLKGCEQRGKTIYIHDSCEVAFEILYADGRFVFTEEEIDHMRPVNQSKISNLKAWFQTKCPDHYRRTLGGRIKKKV